MISGKALGSAATQACTTILNPNRCEGERRAGTELVRAEPGGGVSVGRTGTCPRWQEDQQRPDRYPRPRRELISAGGRHSLVAISGSLSSALSLGSPPVRMAHSGRALLYGPKHAADGAQTLSIFHECTLLIDIKRCWEMEACSPTTARPQCPHACTNFMAWLWLSSSRLARTVGWRRRRRERRTHADNQTH